MSVVFLLLYSRPLQWYSPIGWNTPTARVDGGGPGQHYLETRRLYAKLAVLCYSRPSRINIKIRIVMINEQLISICC